MTSLTFSCFAPTLYRWRTQALQQALEHGVDPVGVDWLLREVAGVDRLQLRLLPQKADRPLALHCSLDTLDRLWQQHLSDRTPLQYLAGFTHWRTFKLQVSPAVLIPRPETELLIDWVEHWLRHHPHAPHHQGHWADLGTGSGAIAIAIARARPDLRVIATDRSAAALATARRNAQALLAAGAAAIDWREGVWWSAIGPDERVALAIANPPYLAADDPHLIGELRFEPREALVAGVDGLADLRTIAAGAPAHLEAGGWLLLEHGWTQGPDVRNLLQAAGLRDVATRLDDQGRERITLGRRSREADGREGSRDAGSFLP